MHAASRTLRPGELQSSPVGHRCGCALSHVAVGSVIPLALASSGYSSSKAPFSAVTCVLGRKLLTRCQSWGQKQKHHQPHESREGTPVYFGVGFRVSLGSVPTDLKSPRSKEPGRATGGRHRCGRKKNRCFKEFSTPM